MLTTAIYVSFFLSPVDSPLSQISQFDPVPQETTRIYLVRHGQSAFNIPDENGILYTSGSKEETI